MSRHAPQGQGFALSMTYVALDSVERHIERVATRADRGGHSAPVENIRQIHAASMRHLRQVIKEFDYLAVYDNSGEAPVLVLEAANGRATLRNGGAIWLPQFGSTTS